MDDLGKYWNYPLVTLSTGPQITVSQLVLAVLVVVVGIALTWFLQRLLGRQLIKANVDPNVAQVMQRIIFYSILVILFITALGMLRIPVTALAFISGAVAIGIGFGAQNIINNLISGWILMSERPVRIGDFVEIDSNRGIVESIGNRSTRIKRVDGVHLLVPNSQMLERMVINWTLVDKQIRTTIRIGVAYGSQPQQVAETIEQAVRAQADVLDDPAPRVIFEDFGDNALIFDAIFWCNVGGERELRQVRSNIRFKISELFGERNITIAFPQRDVHIDGIGPLQVELVGDDDKAG